MPVISNREYSATTTLKDGESTVVVGFISKIEQKGLSGLPGIGHIPIIGLATASRSKDMRDDELLVVVTPYIVSPARPSFTGDEVWVPTM